MLGFTYLLTTRCTCLLRCFLKAADMKIGLLPALCSFAKIASIVYAVNLNLVNVKFHFRWLYWNLHNGWAIRLPLVIILDTVL